MSRMLARESVVHAVQSILHARFKIYDISDIVRLEKISVIDNQLRGKFKKKSIISAICWCQTNIS